MQGRAEPALDVFGRDSELTALRGLVAAARRIGALLLTCAAGMGKTALWEAGLEMARAAGRFVLAARPAKTEARMAFAGLIDLCDRVLIAHGLAPPGRMGSLYPICHRERGAPGAWVMPRLLPWLSHA